MSRLALGTAQFGSPYGVTNRRGKLPDEAVAGILAAARAAGHDLIDTSPAYGDAQRRLGQLAPAGMSYVSKFALPATRARSVDTTLDALGVDRLHAMLFHDVGDLRDERAADAVGVLRAARDDGVISRIGVSVYDDADLDAALAVFPDLDIVQVPGSVADRRLLDSPLLARVHDAGVEVHVRSVYLQGVLVADPATLPAFLAPLGPSLETMRDAVAAAQTTMLSAALRFVRDHPVVDAVVVGAVSTEEFAATADAWADPAPAPELPHLGLDGSVLDPRRWPTRSSW